MCAKVTSDTSHLWGDFNEVFVDNNLIFRSIRLYEDGASSIHKHATSELLLVESGKLIEWLENESGKIEKRTYSKGDIIEVPANKWHRIEYLSGDYSDEYGVKFVQVIELMFGDNKGGNYKIIRKEKALPSKKKERLLNEKNLPN